MNGRNLTSRTRRRYNRQESFTPIENCISDGQRQKEEDMAYSPSSLLIDYVKQWLSDTKKLEVKPATYDRLEVSCNTLEDYEIAQKAIESITTRDFQLYVGELVNEGYSLSTIKKQMRIVSAPMRYAYEQRIIPFNPCASVKTPAKSNVHKVAREILAYTEDEQAKIRRVLDTRARVGYYVIELLLETGMRAGEALALNWSDVMVDKRRIRVHATVINLANRRRAYVQEGAKSPTSNRWVPLSTRAIAILKELKASSKHDWLFDSHGKRLSYEALRYQCQCACADAGVPYYGLHAWRHTFATNQYYKGTDVKILSKLLGHADTTITYNIYIHLYGDGFDDMLRALS